MKMREFIRRGPPRRRPGDPAGAAVTGARMPAEQFSFVKSATFREPSRVEVRKDSRVIGRILHVAETVHAEEMFQFHKGMTSIASRASAQYTNLDELKKWIRESQ
jgi:hypothetical protein